MSRLQEAVDRFAADWWDRHYEKPAQSLLFDGAFSRFANEPFCLCFQLATGIGQLINFTGLTCADCEKPVTGKSYEWFDEARAERESGKHLCEWID